MYEGTTPHDIVPITVTSGPSTKLKYAEIALTESFSLKFKSKLPPSLIREIGKAFRSLNGKSFSTIQATDTALSLFCEFLVTLDRPPGSLRELTSDVLYEYREFTIRTHPPKMRCDGTQSNPWYFSHFYRVRSLLSPVIGDKTFPYTPRPSGGHNEGHSPYAMQMMLLACREELDQIRRKFEYTVDGKMVSKWDLAVERGEAKDTSFFDLVLNCSTKRGLAYDQIDDFIKCVTASDRPSWKKVAKRFGLSPNGARDIAIKLQNGELVTPQLKVEDVDLTLDDAIATIAKYLPDWPLDGKLRAKENLKEKTEYRVYSEPRGILQGSYLSCGAAEEEAAKIGGVVVTELYGNCSFERMNPGEIILCKVFGARKGRLLAKVADSFNLSARGAYALVSDFFPTAYDWGVIYLYWCCLTGWNNETILSVPMLQLRRMERGQNEISPLSEDHVIFKGEGTNKNNYEEILPISGEKTRSQPEDRPALFTHVSDKGDEYGLFQVLSEYFHFSRPLRKYLANDQQSCILFGVSQTAKNDRGKYINAFGGKMFSRPDIITLPQFFKKHKIYEDPEHTLRISNTNASKIRSTYFSTLLDMDVPISTQQFLGRHKTMDTTMLSYLEDGVSVGILRRRARVNLEKLSSDAFAGQLKRYDQKEETEERSMDVLVFNHMGNNVFGCLNPWNPTWENHEMYLGVTEEGKLTKACEREDMCLFCKQCVIAKDSLRFLFRWKWDIHNWKKENGFLDFPETLLRRHQAIEEVFALCEAAGAPWRKALVEEEAIAMDEDFCAPMGWRSI